MAVRRREPDRPVWTERASEGRYSNNRAVEGDRRRKTKTAYTKTAYRRAPKNGLSMLAIVVCVGVITAAIYVNSVSLQKKIDAYDIRIQELQEEIDKETARAEKIEEFRKYTQTKGFVEEMAQDVLGLVYDGEILFKQE